MKLHIVRVARIDIFGQLIQLVRYPSCLGLKNGNAAENQIIFGGIAS